MIELFIVIIFIGAIWLLKHRDSKPSFSGLGLKLSNTNWLRGLPFWGALLALVYFSVDIIKWNGWETIPQIKSLQEITGIGPIWFGVLAFIFLFLIIWKLKPKKENSGESRSISDKFDDWNFTFFTIGAVVVLVFLSAAIMEPTGVFVRIQRIMAGEAPTPISAECKAPEDLGSGEKRVDMSGRCIRVSRFDKPFSLLKMDGYYDENNRYIQSGLDLEVTFAESMKTTHPDTFKYHKASEFLKLNLVHGLAYWYTPDHNNLADAGIDWVDLHVKAVKTNR